MVCDKFEKLYTQDDESELMEHILVCPECKAEYERMKAVSSLIKEAKPLYKKEKQQRPKLVLAMVAGMSFLVLTGLVLASRIPDYNYDKAVESEIYPTDEYGLMELY